MAATERAIKPITNGDATEPHRVNGVDRDPPAKPKLSRVREITEKQISLGLPWAISLLVTLIAGTIAIVLHVGAITTQIEVIKQQVTQIDRRSARSAELEVELARFDERLRALQLSAPSVTIDTETRRMLSEILRNIQAHPPSTLPFVGRSGSSTAE